MRRNRLFRSSFLSNLVACLMTEGQIGIDEKSEFVLDQIVFTKMSSPEPQQDVVEHAKKPFSSHFNEDRW